MSILTKKLHITNIGGSEETANIYTTTSECPEPNLKVKVDETNGYVKLGSTTSPFATKGRVYRTSDNTTYAILKQHTVSDFPVSWGKFTGFKCALTMNKDYNTYQYGWSLHFQNGTLPIPVGYSATGSSVTWDADNYEETTLSSLNSAIYAGGNVNKWVNAQAFEQDGYLIWWDSNNQGVAIISKRTAMSWGWPNESVETTDFTASVSDGVLIIKKNGSTFKTFNVYV